MNISTISGVQIARLSLAPNILIWPSQILSNVKNVKKWNPFLQQSNTFTNARVLSFLAIVAVLLALFMEVFKKFWLMRKLKSVSLTIRTICARYVWRW